MGLALLLILVAVFGAQGVRLASGIETLISPKSQVYQDFLRYTRNFGGDSVIVILKGKNLPDLIQPQNLQMMADLEFQLAQRQDVFFTASPASAFSPLLKKSLPETSPEELEALVLDENGEMRPEFGSLFPNKQHALMIVTLKGDLSLEEVGKSVKEISGVIEGISFQGIDPPVITGNPVISNQIDDLIISNLRKSLALSAVLMFLILAFIFTVRGLFLWRWLSLGVMVLAVIYAFGLMGWLNIALTMSTMAVFPILVGLGIDYSIQLHNRYDEEIRKGQPFHQAGKISVLHIGPAIGIALLATIFGISALFFSSMSLITGFAKMLIIGLAVAYITALFLTPVFLQRRRPCLTGAGGSPNKPSKLERALSKIGEALLRYPAIIVPLALAVAIAGLVVDSRIGVETDETKYISQDLPPIQELRRLEQTIGSVSALNILVEGDIARPEVLDWMQQVEGQVRELKTKGVNKVASVADLIAQLNGSIPSDPATIEAIIQESPLSLRQELVNPSLTAANLVIQIRNISVNELKTLQSGVKGFIGNSSPPDGVKASLTGFPLLQAEIWDSLTAGRREMTLWSMVFIFAGLLLLFRGKIHRAILASLPSALVVGWSALFMYLIGMKFNPLTSTMGALILGMGTEYTILLLWRYDEERRNGEEPNSAMTRAISRLGRAILVSGLTTMAGFGALLIAREFIILQDFSILTVVDIALALVSALVVLPPLVVWLDKRRVAIFRQ